MQTSTKTARGQVRYTGLHYLRGVGDALYVAGAVDAAAQAEWPATKITSSVAVDVDC